MVDPNPSEPRPGTHNAVDGGAEHKIVQARTVDNAHLGSGHQFNGPVIFQAAAAERDALTLRFDERLEEAERRVRELTEREQELRGLLDAQVVRSDELDRQLREVLARLSGDRAENTALRHRVEQLQHDHDQEITRAAELRAELTEVTSRRQEAERQVELVQADKDELRTFFGSLEDLLELNFERAEVERREKERLLGECESLRRQVSTVRQEVRTLQQTLAMYQSQS